MACDYKYNVGASLVRLCAARERRGIQPSKLPQNKCLLRRTLTMTLVYLSSILGSESFSRRDVVNGSQSCPRAEIEQLYGLVARASTDEPIGKEESSNSKSRPTKTKGWKFFLLLAQTNMILCGFKHTATYSHAM